MLPNTVFVHGGKTWDTAGTEGLVLLHERSRGAHLRVRSKLTCVLYGKVTIDFVFVCGCVFPNSEKLCS